MGKAEKATRSGQFRKHVAFSSQPEEHGFPRRVLDTVVVGDDLDLPVAADSPPTSRSPAAPGSSGSEMSVEVTRSPGESVEITVSVSGDSGDLRDCFDGRVRGVHEHREGGEPLEELLRLSLRCSRGNEPDAGGRDDGCDSDYPGAGGHTFGHGRRPEVVVVELARDWPAKVGCPD